MRTETNDTIPIYITDQVRVYWGMGVRLCKKAFTHFSDLTKEDLAYQLNTSV